ncbi:MAG: DUF5123 domain-containing protein [Deltaproteobacteria bacterium]|nr:DUF5123 domain-containing protein [Deltaproteobacteria bacterium]
MQINKIIILLSTILISISGCSPRAFIESPEDGANFDQGEGVIFTANANDYEDGQLKGASLTWSSDRDGQFGTGEVFTCADLSAGEHTITLSATDSDGDWSEDSVTIIIDAISDNNAADSAEVSSLQAAAGDGLLTLTWIDPDMSDLDHIEITWTPDAPTEPQVFDAGIQQATIEDLTNGTAYIFSVKTVTTDGTASDGRTLTATPTAISPAGSLYYVATNGDDSNPGSLANPWLTIQKAADSVAAGSTVYVRGGVYSEQVTIGVSGSKEGGYITFQNYDGETPILDGTSLDVPETDSGLFLIKDRSYLIIQGFELRNYRSSTRDIVPIGINIRGAGSHIQIRDNRIHTIETNATVDFERLGADAHGLAVYGTSASASLNNIVIDDNELYDLKLGQSEALVLNGNVETFTISNNTIRDVDNIGIDIIGFEETSPDTSTDQARNGIINDNTIYNVSSYGNPGYGNEYSAGGIYVDGGNGIMIERNTISSCDYGIEIASEHKNRSTSDITVRSNILFQNRISGIAMGGYDDQRGSTVNCTIVNNTLYHNDTLQDGSGEILLAYDNRNNTIKNNIFVANDQSLFISNEFTENSGNTFDHNLYFASAGENDSEWQWKSETCQGFQTYRQASGNDQNSLFLSPGLVNPDGYDFHLTPGSPAVDAGTALSSAGDYDIDGQSRIQGSAIDLGADEYQ